MRAALGFTLALLLAGCVQPEVAVPDPVEPVARPALHAFEVDLAGDANQPFCTPAICINADSGYPLQTFAPNETLVGFDLRLELRPGLHGPLAEGSTFDWAVECVADQGCDAPLAAVRSTSTTLHLAVHNLSIAAPYVFTHVYGTLPVQGPFATGGFPFNLTGRLWFQSTPGPELAVQVHPVSAEGVTGACVFQADPRCHSTPHGTATLLRSEGFLREFTVTASWSAQTATMEEMRLEAKCQMPDYGSCGVARSTFSAVGRSPLALTAEELRFPKGAWVSIDLVATQALGFGGVTEYRLDGSFTALEPERVAAEA